MMSFFTSNWLPITAFVAGNGTGAMFVALWVRKIKAGVIAAEAAIKSAV